MLKGLLKVPFGTNLVRKISTKALKNGTTFNAQLALFWNKYGTYLMHIFVMIEIDTFNSVKMAI